MGKMSKALLLGVSVLFLLSTTFMACGSSEEENGNVVIKTPIERLQSLELGVLDVQSAINEAGLDYSIIQNRVDQIRDDFDVLSLQISNMNTGYPITEDMYNEITTNMTILQRVSFILHQRIDALEDTINGS